MANEAAVNKPDDFADLGFVPRSDTPKSEASPKAAQNDYSELGFVPTPSKEQMLFRDAHNKIASGLEWAGQKYDSYLTSPFRAMHGAAQKGESPLRAYIKQFGQDPDRAPTGTELAINRGASQKEVANVLGHPITPANIEGTFYNFVEDPLILGAPIKAGVKLAYGAAKAVIPPLIGGAAKGVDWLTNTTLATRTMSKVGKTAEYAQGSAKAGQEAFHQIFNSAPDKHFGDFVEIAKKNHIDPTLLPESVEFGTGTIIDNAARFRREGLLGKTHMENFQKGYLQTQDAFLRKTQEIGGGTVLSPIEAGNSLRKGFDEGVNRFFDGIDLTHDEILKYAPGLYVDREAMEKVNSVANGIEKFAKGRAERGISAAARQQGQELLNAVEAFRSGNGNYKQTVEALRDIGDEAFRTQHYLGKVPPDTEKLRKLYFAIDDALIDTVHKHVNPEFALELRVNNNLMHEFFESKNQIGHIVGNRDIAPENVFNRIVMNGDSEQIEALKHFLTPEQLAQQRAAFMENLVKRGPDGIFDFNHLHAAVNKKKIQAEGLFSEAQQEFKDLGEIVSLGTKFGKAATSSFGTGGSLDFLDLVKAFKSGVANDTIIEHMKSSARNQGKALPGPGLPTYVSPVKGLQMLEAPNRPPDNAIGRKLQQR